ncbi:MAG: hypothetical protein Q4F05_16400 [bacterium]|nr:hypothetical protein [bacterium]
MKKICHKAKFPVIMTGISLLLLLGTIVVEVTQMVEPYYPLILLVFVPLICFTILTILRTKEKIGIRVTNSMTAIVLGVWVAASVISLPFMVVDMLTSPPTTNPSNYEKLLKVSGYPNYELNSFFPSEIPEGAQNIVLDSSEPFLQGGEIYALKYKMDNNTIQNYINVYTKTAIWLGTQKEAEGKENGLEFQSFSWAGYSDQLPNDFTLYLLRSIKGSDNSWNHGEIGYVAISKQQKEVIFYAEYW